MDNHDDAMPQGMPNKSFKSAPPPNLPVDSADFRQSGSRPAYNPQSAQRITQEPIRQFTPQQPPQTSAPVPVAPQSSAPSPAQNFGNQATERPVPPPNPPKQPYMPAVPNFSDVRDGHGKKRPSLLSVIVAVLAVIIILGLAFLLYYYATQTFQPPRAGQSPVVSSESKKITPEPEQSAAPAVIPTSVIVFKVPDVLPTEQKLGNCWVNSIAEPFRKDAWRCMVGSTVYDPCFEMSQKGLVYCPMNLLSGSGDATLIKLTKPLPQPILPKTVKDNWAWLIKTEDGIFFSPYTGTKPFVDGTFATYGSKIVNGERFVLMGDLVKGEIWTAQEKVLVKNGTSWVVKSTKTIKIDTIWQ
ncbi:MAG: hypothetical protein A2599_03355 [Candidatus Staskawiczbacteria bacterium RIFOXYD1_FULL_39_28]|uniref:Uncharacterized protein n=1 Tax=Candidatus Staskawiczbacteria bacterium RIFOXYC1_FULL_38_18 TaxID=1802229 RepID=A0A1G2JBJ2_9BACT|nr:MAG: hypothetical protein A2401_03665 [Candidatus Staskawiczbacteria bacterium RIFOXYC1_FULL_38_18]OGZ90329.1 MAG: hypothetical protein A2599_03355 [Candidatus Staskawiczbacteria bacterium RIFOXYD1_FULL_39_28]